MCKVDLTVATTKHILLTDCYQSLAKYYEKQYIQQDTSTSLGKSFRKKSTD